MIDDPRELALTVAASDQARARGVNAVPHMVIGDRALVGCRSEDEIAAAITAARSAQPSIHVETAVPSGR